MNILFQVILKNNFTNLKLPHYEQKIQLTFFIKKVKSKPTAQLQFICQSELHRGAKLRPNDKRTSPNYAFCKVRLSRITIDGKLKEIASKKYILPDKQDDKLQKKLGSSEEVKSLNVYLKT